MRTTPLLLALALGSTLLGCSRADPLPPPQRPTPVASMFNPASMRLHPALTRVKNWTAPSNPAASPADPAQAPKPDGVEVELEFNDAFGDPVKAEGRVIFELYGYRTDAADVRGPRITTPFVGSLLTADEQKARWNRVTRTYSFRLAYPDLDANRSYVLTATFEPRAGGRFYSRIILQPTPGV